MPTEPLRIDKEETFPHLSRAAITEAVIEIKARAETEWLAEDVAYVIAQKLEDYPTREERRELTAGFQFEPKQDAMTKLFHKPSFSGFECRSADNLQFVRFLRDSFLFGRLHPYSEWESFSQEALRLFEIHRELANPTEIHRIGVRFINQLPLEIEGLDFDDYLVAGPREPRGFKVPFGGFFHNDLLAIPGHDYAVKITRTVNPSPQGTTTATLILDIDVFTAKPISANSPTLPVKLAEMRWLKNKAFFGSITEKAIQLLK
jgi:uncharacterized protein (TIGR04255 family)